MHDQSNLNYNQGEDSDGEVGPFFEAVEGDGDNEWCEPNTNYADNNLPLLIKVVINLWKYLSSSFCFSAMHK